MSDDRSDEVLEMYAQDESRETLTYNGYHCDDPGPEPPPDESSAQPVWPFVDGATFVLDIPPTIPALWGVGGDVLWAEGESLMIAGPMGLGKTTLEGLLIRAQLVGGDVLGLPVAKRSGVILVLAMDRPSQIARSMHRQFGEDERKLLAERVKVWRGPPPADLARRPELLTRIAEAAGAETVFLDSVKDAAIGLSDDEVGAGYNRARQILLETGVQLAESHHTVKRGAGGGPPASVADVYGSAWITNGCGSLVLLSGEPGDPIVGFRHLRAPANEVGPWRLLHDQTSGVLSVEHAGDFVELAAACGISGLNAKHAAAVLYECSEPTRSQCEKARRKLDQLVAAGLLTRVEGTKGGGAERNPAAWFPA